jgi:hypothetical protein
VVQQLFLLGSIVLVSIASIVAHSVQKDFKLTVVRNELLEQHLKMNEWLYGLMILYYFMRIVGSFHTLREYNTLIRQTVIYRSWAGAQHKLHHSTRLFDALKKNGVFVPLPRSERPVDKRMPEDGHPMIARLFDKLNTSRSGLDMFKIGEEKVGQIISVRP